MSGGEAERNQIDSTHIIGSSIEGDKQMRVPQPFHEERPRFTPTTPRKPRDDTISIDTVEHCRYFATNDLAKSHDKKGSLRLHVLWETRASHNFVSRKWLNRCAQLFGTCRVVD